VILEPVLTPEQKKELEDLASEEELQRAVVNVIALQVKARIAKGKKFQVIGDSVKMSDREYVVRPDGALQRAEPTRRETFTRER